MSFPFHLDAIGEALRLTQDHLDAKNFYAFNPSFDVRTPQPRKPAPYCGA